MNLANVYNNIAKAYEAATDPAVLHPLQEAMTEISSHMDKEKERVKKYRGKDYVKPDPHTCATDSKGRCKTCGTPLTVAKPKEVYPTPDEFAKTATTVKVKHPKPKVDAMDEALELLDSPLPTIHHDGVMDDLEDDTPEPSEGVCDDLDLVSLL